MDSKLICEIVQREGEMTGIEAFLVFSVTAFHLKRPEATNSGQYVTAINCLKEIALQQMILTKKRYGKNDQYIAWHGYQSFSVDEIEPELAHEIGVKLAREMWGDRFQILVTTHLNKGHIHNHFCFTPYLSGMEKSTTTQNPRYKGSGTVPTGCAGSMDYPSLKIPGNPQAGLPGWMKKPGNLRGTMFTGKILKKRCIAATTWKNSSSI